jgi:hypothetical protein
VLSATACDVEIDANNVKSVVVVFILMAVNTMNTVCVTLIGRVRSGWTGYPKKDP